MPQARKRTSRRQANSAPQSDRRGLLVFSIDNPLDYAPQLGKVVVAMAAHDQAEARGADAPFLAGLDKLSELRPKYQSDAVGESEVS
ncbi:hypothetical protein ACFOYW_18315 [Gryllotalpicola reticulitermitis]|uniref:Uncharacterized protein n=1 Tax=Gryllotalpicola reticulitermitis TaxID=1184153 RepID=A0ABV8QCD3_9MICO